MLQQHKCQVMVVVISTLGIRREFTVSEMVRGNFKEKVNFELSPKGQLGFRQGASNKGILDDGQIYILYTYIYICQII